MKNRKFLVPLAILAAAFASGESKASVHESSESAHSDTATTTDAVSPNRIFFNKGQDQFSFVLKRMEGGMIMADHESHASHSSHSSHRSHYSGY